MNVGKAIKKGLTANALFLSFPAVITFPEVNRTAVCDTVITLATVELFVDPLTLASVRTCIFRLQVLTTTVLWCYGVLLLPIF